MRIKVDIMSTVDIRLAELARVDNPMKEYANMQLARYCEPYVPMRNGMLLSGVQVTPEAVTYPGPYAHYQYEGVVYDPNYPIVENGAIVGFYSPPGMAKNKTDRLLDYSKDIHPLATSKWDKAAMAVRKQDLAEDIRDYIIDRDKGAHI